MGTRWLLMVFSTCQVLQAVEEAQDWGGEGTEGKRSGSYPGPWQLGGLARRQSVTGKKLQWAPFHETWKTFSLHSHTLIDAHILFLSLWFSDEEPASLRICLAWERPASKSSAMGAPGAPITAPWSPPACAAMKGRHFQVSIFDWFFPLILKTISVLKVYDSFDLGWQMIQK